MKLPIRVPADKRGEMIGHRTETGEPCVHHSRASIDTLLQLALIGSRSQAFNHDCASKLQGLIMALDDLTELNDPRTRSAVDTAMTASRELHVLLNAARALTKSPAPARTRLGDLVATAADRMRITLQGASLDNVEVTVAAQAFTQALALVLDVAGGPGRSRELAYTYAIADKAVTLELACAAAPANAGDLLAIASYALGRDHATLCCSADGKHMLVRMPLS